MKKPHSYAAALIGLGSCLLCLTLTGTVYSQQDAGLGERIGQQLDRGIARISEEVSEGWAALRQTVNQMGVQGRVYGRLRWDKDIATEAIEVDTEEEGVVVLRGELRNQQAREKAVTLAQDTVGVTRVIDQLTVTATAEASAVDTE